LTVRPDGSGRATIPSTILKVLDVKSRIGSRFEASTYLINEAVIFRVP